jgi:hypothetical protein
MAGAATTQSDTTINTVTILSKSSTNETVTQRHMKVQEPTATSRLHSIEIPSKPE